jgi:hypothetical protein
VTITTILISQGYSGNAFYYYFVYSEESDLGPWIAAFFGTWAICFFVIAELELMNLFYPIAPLMSSEVVRKCQVAAVLLQIVLHGPLYGMKPIVVDPPAFYKTVLANNVVGLLWSCCICCRSLIFIPMPSLLLVISHIYPFH